MVDLQHQPVQKNFKVYAWTAKNCTLNNYRKSSIIETIVLVSLKEVCKTIGVLQCRIQIIWQSLPIGNGLGIAGFYRWSLQGIETPEFAAFEEIDFAITSPYHGSIQMIGHSGKAFANILRVFTIHLTSVVAPVFGALEEVGLAIFVGEGRIDVACVRKSFRIKAQRYSVKVEIKPFKVPNL